MDLPSYYYTVTRSYLCMYTCTNLSKCYRITASIFVIVAQFLNVNWASKILTYVKIFSASSINNLMKILTIFILQFLVHMFLRNVSLMLNTQKILENSTIEHRSFNRNFAKILVLLESTCPLLESWFSYTPTVPLLMYIE